MEFKSKLHTASGGLLGSFLGTPSPSLVEMLGQASYDFVIIDAEHGSFNTESIEECLRAATAVNIPCLVRIAELDARLIQLALDLGASGIQVPQVETALQASEAVQYSHFPPIGTRGYGSTTRAAAYGFRPRNLVKEMVQRELVVNIQIESKTGVDNLSAIQETEGIDVIFIGTTDLSMAYGYDSPNDPAIIALLSKLVSSIVSAGKVAGLHISDWSALGQLQQMGVRYFTVSAAALIRDAFIEQVRDFATKVKREKQAGS